MKKIIPRIGSILFLCLLLLNPKISIEGARTGLVFWFQTIIPTLLPFIIGSNLIILLDATKYLTAVIHKVFGPILRISEYGSYVMLIGFLCGYPTGAKTSADMVTSGKITKQEGQYLLSFCNHASPMFLAGFLLSAISAPHKGTLLLAYYLPVIPIAILSMCYHRMPKAIHQNKAAIIKAAEKSSKTDLLDQAMMDAFEVILKVGGHIILFSILEAYFAKLPISNMMIKSLILGGTEITTGLASIGHIFGGSTIGELLAVAVTAFGGLSGLSQTKSVTKSSGLSTGSYFMWKALHGLSSAGCFLLLLKFAG